ncbi:hypothetical protein MSG28_011633 [Choristoneura fumiferana]|uniref:Uncharacterized protein n=1 Tax=Choristoneura fumiferana TaxID=7141 RepID=A0ACC0KM08_CHOFU|nr:hypothetical protein MSG28_011633 [Choristoneura fumiferana]
MVASIVARALEQERRVLKRACDRERCGLSFSSAPTDVQANRAKSGLLEKFISEKQLARCEELSAAAGAPAHELQQHSADGDVGVGGVYQTQSELGAHREFLSQKLAALASSRRAWTLPPRAPPPQGTLPTTSTPPHATLAPLAANSHAIAPIVLLFVQESVESLEPEVREVLENFNNLERECSAARQPVAPALRDRAAACAPTGPR